MASKPQKAARKGVVYKNRQPQGHKVEAIARRRVTCRAQSNVEKCNMVLRVYLLIPNLFVTPYGYGDIPVLETETGISALKWGPQF